VITRVWIKVSDFLSVSVLVVVLLALKTVTGERLTIIASPQTFRKPAKPTCLARPHEAAEDNHGILLRSFLIRLLRIRLNPDQVFRVWSRTHFKSQLGCGIIYRACAPGLSVYAALPPMIAWALPQAGPEWPGKPT
jgi:hypothetical protein